MVTGTNKSILYSIGWSVLYGIVLALIIAAIVWVVFSAGVREVRNELEQGNLMAYDGLVSSMGYIYVAVMVLSMVGMIVITYKSLQNPYGYGWADAEAHHNIPEERRKCKENENCKDMP